MQRSLLPPAPRAPAVQHALVCPGAPRRVRNLLPPPAVPAAVLAALRPPSKPIAGGGMCDSDDTAASAAPVPPAMQQANTWLSSIISSRASLSLP